jgi:hypothetical protein
VTRTGGLALAVALWLSVTAAAQEPPGIDVRVVAEAVPRRAYVGERVTLTYALARGAAPLLTPVREVRLAEAPRFPNFWANEVEVRDDEGELDVERDGMRMTPLRRFHVYPVTAGRLRIDPPAYTMLAYPTTIEGVEAMPLRITRRAAPVEVEAVPLPDAGRPATFGGAVGRFSVAASLGAAEVAPGEAVRLEVTISGDGNLESTGPPRVAPADGVRVTSPRRVSVDLGLASPDGIGRAVWHLDAVPEREGRLTIGPVELDYFDPRSGRYAVARSAPLALSATARAESAPATAPAPVRGSRWWLLLALAGVAAAALALLVRVARRESRPPAPPAAHEPDRAERAKVRVRVRRELVLADEARRRGDDREAYARLLAALRIVWPDGPQSPEAAALYERCREAAYGPAPPPVDRATIEHAARVIDQPAQRHQSRSR